MTPLERIRLEKAAADCGFERTPELTDDGALALRSAQFPEVVWLHSLGVEGFRVKASHPALVNDAPDATALATNIEKLYAVLSHAAATARTLPNRVADVFRQKTAHLPATTEAERLVVQRVGQNLFRQALLDYWHSRCAVTGLAVPELLRASHIRPWAQCASDNERLDVFNGLLLAPHVDALFDGGWISFADHGGVLVSKALSNTARGLLNVSSEWGINRLTPSHARYLAHHREQVFRQG
jgi:hypothetical protein